MTVFKYTAVTKAGNKIEGQREAKEKDEVVKYLLNNGMTIISITEDFSVNFSNLLKIEIGSFSLNERVLIAKQLATMISSGIPVIQAIDILRQQSEKESLKKTLDEVYKKIEAGSSLSGAFQQAGKIFNEVQISLIAAGEKSGNLNEMLIKVAEDMEKSKNLRGKVTGALIYPAIIFAVLIVIVAIMILFMVPQVQELYSSLGQDTLPLVTRIMVAIGRGLGRPIVLFSLIMFIFSVVVLYKFYTSKPEGRLNVDKVKLKVPVFGNLSRKIQLVQFSRIMSMLMSSGIPIIEAIEITSRAMGNSVFQKILLGAKEELTKGSTLSGALAKNNINEAFPLIMLKMVATGEESGKIDKILGDLTFYYEEEVNQISNNLTKLMEPFILVVVGGMVAFLAVAIYLPIYQVGNLFN